MSDELSTSYYLEVMNYLLIIMYKLWIIYNSPNIINTKSISPFLFHTQFNSLPYLSIKILFLGPLVFSQQRDF